MKQKEFTQFGYIMMAISIPLIGIVLINHLSEEPDLALKIILSSVSVFVLLNFYRLTILVDETHISFKMGIGLFGKKFPISDIESCKPVTNSILYGIGIRIMENGWLYNVSGLKAIELHFKNRKSVVRIGTNKPEEICALVEEMQKSGELNSTNQL